MQGKLGKLPPVVVMRLKNNKKQWQQHEFLIRDDARERELTSHSFFLDQANRLWHCYKCNNSKQSYMCKELNSFDVSEERFPENLKSFDGISETCKEQIAQYKKRTEDSEEE